jgi:hypothetical protein
MTRNEDTMMGRESSMARRQSTVWADLVDVHIAPEHVKCRTDRRHHFVPHTVEKERQWLTVVEKCDQCGAAYKTYEINPRTAVQTPAKLRYDPASNYIRKGEGKLPPEILSKMRGNRKLDELAAAGLIVRPKPRARR